MSLGSSDCHTARVAGCSVHMSGCTEGGRWPRVALSSCGSWGCDRVHTGRSSGSGGSALRVPQCELPTGSQGDGVTQPCHWPGRGGPSGQCPPIHTWDGVRRRGLWERIRFRAGREGGLRWDQHPYEELRGPGLALPPPRGDTVRRWHL